MRLLLPEDYWERSPGQSCTPSTQSRCGYTIVGRTSGGMVRVRSDVVRQHRWRALYRGFGIMMMRAFLVNGIILPTYEMTSEVLGRMR